MARDMRAASSGTNLGVEHCDAQHPRRLRRRQRGGHGSGTSSGSGSSAGGSAGGAVPGSCQPGWESACANVLAGRLTPPPAYGASASRRSRAVVLP